MRELKFRGKNITTNEWVYGSLVNNLWTYASHHSLAGKNVCEIITTESNECDDYEDMQEKGMNITVHPDSVGQITGLEDSNGKELYEGDIIQWEYNDFSEKLKCQVRYNPYMGCFDIPMDNNGQCPLPFEVIGNIHDNIELLTS